MHIHRADLPDLATCLAIDGSYDTDYVWQVTEQEEPGEIVEYFRTVRLPRVMRVAYPSWSEALLAHQERGDLILVATEADEVRGYVDLQPQPDQGSALLHHLIVQEAHRRRGLGTALLARSMADVRHQDLQYVVASVQSKNFPAISFFQRNGFRFCGYNERYFRNQDIALYFACGL
jgi:ribosomal protein S18 acetylase RimI-like enzyme